MQKHVNLVDLVKSFPTNILLQNLASIQQRTSPIKLAHLADKPEKGSISNFSTKVETALTPYVEKDGTVTYELIYFALQSQVLCKKSHEAAVVLRVMKFFCVCFAVFMGFNAVFLQTLGLGLGFVYMSMGILGST